MSIDGMTMFPYIVFRWIKEHGQYEVCTYKTYKSAQEMIDACGKESMFDRPLCDVKHAIREFLEKQIKDPTTSSIFKMGFELALKEMDRS